MEQKNISMWIGVGAVLIVVLGLGYYFYSGGGYKPSEKSVQEESGDLSDISAEVQATNVEGLDAELKDIDKELQ